MYTTYTHETIARQRMDETARQARTAHQRRELKARAGWHFPKVTFPSPGAVFTPRPV